MPKYKTLADMYIAGLGFRIHRDPVLGYYILNQDGSVPPYPLDGYWKREKDAKNFLAMTSMLCKRK